MNPILKNRRLFRLSAEVAIIPDCDHFYNGREQTVIEAVTSWLARALGLPRR